MLIIRIEMRGCVVSALDRITDFGSDNTPV